MGSDSHSAAITVIGLSGACAGSPEKAHLSVLWIAAPFRASHPKVWADAWLLAVAQAAGGRLVTLDQALASRGAYCLI